MYQFGVMNQNSLECVLRWIIRKVVMCGILACSAASFVQCQAYAENVLSDVVLLTFATQGADVMPEADQNEVFLTTPGYVGPVTEDRAPATRAFQGIPSVAIARNGRFWATWYAGCMPDEDENNYVVVATSGDGLGAWTEALVVDPDGRGPVRAFDPELWIDPDGKLWSFWAQAIGHDGTVAGVWAMTTENPESAQPAWSSPRRLTDGVMMCKPIVLSTGEWVLPASTWRDTDHSARVVVSEDKGATWHIRGACDVPKDVREFDEHMIIERRDGSLWMLVRTKYGIGESVSGDRGKTWSILTRSALAHPSARFFISRLHSGNLLLVKHGPLDKATGRCLLTAYRSVDDGKTWEGGLLLDEREGVSYPDGQQREDGTICVVYDYARTKDREILMARFTEEDIVSGTGGEMRVRISKALPD